MQFEPVLKLVFSSREQLAYHSLRREVCEPAYSVPPVPSPERSRVNQMGVDTLDVKSNTIEIRQPLTLTLAVLLTIRNWQLWTAIRQEQLVTFR